MSAPEHAIGVGGTVTDRAGGALLGTFVGDALGMPYEGCSRGAVPAVVEMVPARLGRGTYTDDTQMMIALAESLIERGRVDAGHLALAFQQAYEPDRGYGGGTRKVFELWAAGVRVDDAAGRVFDGQGSRGNGAAMRIAPVAVCHRTDPQRLVAEAAVSARVTHTHPVGVDGAVVQAAAIGAALRDEPILEVARAAARTEEMRASLDDVGAQLAEGGDPSALDPRLRSSSDACESVCAAIYSALAHQTFEASVCFAVALGGDTDTVGAMTGAIAGARYGTRSIPHRWLEALENGERGRDHVERLALRLIEQQAHLAVRPSDPASP